MLLRSSRMLQPLFHPPVPVVSKPASSKPATTLARGSAVSQERWGRGKSTRNIKFFGGDVNRKRFTLGHFLTTLFGAYLLPLAVVAVVVSGAQ